MFLFKFGAISRHLWFLNSMVLNSLKFDSCHIQRIRRNKLILVKLVRIFAICCYLCQIFAAIKTPKTEEVAMKVSNENRASVKNKKRRKSLANAVKIRTQKNHRVWRRKESKRVRSNY